MDDSPVNINNRRSGSSIRYVTIILIEEVALNHLPARQGVGLESNRPERAGDISNGKALSLYPSKTFRWTAGSTKSNGELTTGLQGVSPGRVRPQRLHRLLSDGRTARVPDPETEKK
jgi:hypothetical protein